MTTKTKTARKAKTQKIDDAQATPVAPSIDEDRAAIMAWQNEMVAKPPKHILEAQARINADQAERLQNLGKKLRDFIGSCSDVELDQVACQVFASAIMIPHGEPGAAFRKTANALKNESLGQLASQMIQAGILTGKEPEKPSEAPEESAAK